MGTVQFKLAFEFNDLLLTEASVVDYLRRSGEATLHPRLEHAILLGSTAGREILAKRYREFIAVASKFDLPLLLCTPTWRANRERVAEADLNFNVNALAVRFLKYLRAECDSLSTKIFIGGMIGCKNDCYKPEQALSDNDALDFHLWQVKQLADADADFLIGTSLPSISEALGLAVAMADTPLFYIISFIINAGGCLLDGTPLEEAIREIDSLQSRTPLGYMINCAHPSFLKPERLPKEVMARIIGFQGNASSLDHATLDNSPTLQADDLAAWGELMLDLNRHHGVKILGGCCGTGPQHLRYLAEHAGRN